MSDRKKLIFMSILVLWLFWGEAIIFMYPKIETGLIILIFVTAGLGLILGLSNNVDGNFFKLFSYFKAKQKGKKYNGYIYQIVEDDTSDPNAANRISKSLDLHDIDADDTRRKRTCEPDFIPQFVMAHTRCRNEADTAFIGNCCRQTGCGQANRHTALLNGNAGDFIAYFQLWKFQCYSSNQAYLP